MAAWRQRTTVLALCVLLFAATALAATEEKKKTMHVTWNDAAKTYMEKAVELSAKLKDHVAASGKSVNEVLKDNGVDFAAGFKALTSKLTWKDTRDTATKFKEAAEKLQQSLEQAVFPKVKDMGEKMIYRPPKKDPKANVEVQELISHIENSDLAAQISLEIQEGLLSALKSADPSAATVAGELSKAREGVGRLSAWAEKLYENGVSPDEIKELFKKAGFNPVEEEPEKAAAQAAAHEEL